MGLATGAYADSLYRVLRMLAARGIFAEDGDRRFHLTPAASVLQTGVEGSLRSRLRLAWQDLIWATYGELPHTVMTGEPAFDRAHGLPLFDYLAENPQANAAFDKAMAQISGPEDATVAAAYDFGRHRLVVDVGGGRGGLLAAVLQRYDGELLECHVSGRGANHLPVFQHPPRRCHPEVLSAWDNQASA